MQALLAATYKDTTNFSFAGHNTLAKCVKVYDGDTITVVFEYNSALYRFQLRLDGIDTPEMHSADKEIAKKVRNILADWILDKIIWIECGKYDKYGRILANIYSEDKQVCYNKEIMKSGLSHEYHGGTKEHFS